jgi:hypothetical protein
LTEGHRIDSAKHTRLLKSYGATAARIFPAAGEGSLWGRSLSETDALILGLLLECCPSGTTVLRVGESNGLTDLYLAAQPTVDQVLSINGAAGREDMRKMLREYPEEAGKVRFHERAPQVDSPAGTPVLALLDHRPTRQGVREDLEEIYAANPDAAVVVAGCRDESGLFVQAGVADFLESRPPGYGFRLLRDLSPGLATSGLGMVFAEDAAGAGLKALECLAGLFTRQLDPLRLLEREQELIFTVNRYREENEQLSSAYEKLQQKMERLNTYYSSRRYRLADAAIGGAKQFFDRSPLRKKNRPPGS